MMMDIKGGRIAGSLARAWRTSERRVQVSGLLYREDHGRCEGPFDRVVERKDLGRPMMQVTAPREEPLECVELCLNLRVG